MQDTIRKYARKLWLKTQVACSRANTEADFRRHVDPLLDEFCAEIGLNALAHAEYTLASGRADAVFNRFVIEYERPGTLKHPPDQGTRHAVQQVKDYIEALAKK
ncbi:MAG: hypothetical protein ACUVSE_10315, partial [Armatimonadota bacterium]